MKRTIVRGYRKGSGVTVRSHIRHIFMRSKDTKQLPKQGYLYETKYDGVRTHLIKQGQKITLLNRRLNDTTDRYPELQGIKLNAKSAVIDGEIVVSTKDRPFGDFKMVAQRDRLQNPKVIAWRSKSMPVKFMAFDVLSKDNQDVTSNTLEERKKILDKLLPNKQDVVKEVNFSKSAGALLKQAKHHQGEGLIAKKLDSKYHASVTDDWLKYKLLNMNDVVITGYTEGTGKRKNTFGAMQAAVWDGAKFKSVGKVGTGFTDFMLRDFKRRMDKYKIKKEGNIMHIKPKLIARVTYLKKTDKGNYREPRFEALRTDITPKQTHV